MNPSAIKTVSPKINGLTPHTTTITANSKFRIMIPYGPQGRFKIHHFVEHREHAEHNSSIIPNAIYEALA